MTNKHEVHEPGTKPVVWARSEPGTTRFYADPGWSGTNKRAGLGQKTRHGGRYDTARLTLRPLSPLFNTKTCLPARIACFFSC
jgi:hypothetical protein